jgi:hypothetical protein
VAPDWMPTKMERKKLLPLGMMFFCILFICTILRARRHGRERGDRPAPQDVVQLSGALAAALDSHTRNDMSQEGIVTRCSPASSASSRSSPRCSTWPPP